MSRCFPFPPPGYEKKARPDDENFLAKEKHKEKKHKKDKKDREKREGKDKKDKERSEEKHREKKDRKEKHKDKKEKRKDKEDKHKEKEKKKTSDEKNTVGPPECRNGENLASNSVSTNDTSEFKFLFELGKRNRDDDRATENHMVQKITLTGQRRAELPGNIVESNTASLAEGNGIFKDKEVEDNGKSQRQSNKADARDEEDNGKSQRQSNNADTRDMEIDTVRYITGNDQRKVEGVAALVGEKQMEEKEKNKRKHSSDSKGEKHKVRDREKKSKSKDKKREKKEKEEKAKEKKPDKDLQQQQKPRETGKDAEELHSMRPSSHLLKESNKSGIILGKRKESEVNGFLHDNDIRPNKLPGPASTSHQIMVNGSKTEPSKSGTKSLPERKGGTVNNLKANGLNLLSSPQVADNGKKMESVAPAPQFASGWRGTGKNQKVDKKVSPSVLENDRKLEPPQTATQLPQLYGNHNLDNKVPFSHPVLENGRKLEPCQTATQLTSGRSAVIVNHKVDKISRKGINGLTEDQEQSVRSTKPSPAPVQAKENVVESPPVKPPHPDAKYLSQILSVPNVEWSGFDDQEWLFGSKDNNNAKKPRSGSSLVEEETQVWAEAIQVESADVTALPYVIPY
ncbi:hypothetical protein LguiA_011761 [Lonicera macranthoides]